MIQLIDVVKQLNILLFGLDECRYNLVDIIYSCRFHDRLKRFLDNLSVAHVLIQQVLLLNVLVYDRVYTNGQDLDWVCKLLLRTVALFRSHRATKTLVIEFDLLVLFFQLFL